MFDVARQLNFTRALEHFLLRLEELIGRARLQSLPLPPELIDEMALTAGELMLVLTNHPAHQEDELIREVLAHARSLRARLRSEPSEGDQVSKACEKFGQEIAQLVIVSKRAA